MNWKSILVNGLKIILPIAVGVWVINYTLGQMTEDQKTQLYDSIRKANPLWLVLSGVVGIFSHISRAIRWRYALEPLGHNVSLKNSFNSVMTSYFVNIFIPRGGEITRSAVLAKSENVPVTTSFGTVITERLTDLVALALIIALVSISEKDIILNKLNEMISGKEGGSPILLWLAIGAALAGLIFLWLLQKFPDVRAFRKINELKSNFLGGLTSVFKMKKVGAYLFHTALIWALYILMHYICFMSIPATADASFGAVLTSFVIGGISLILISGGLGVYPLAIQSTLLLFNIDGISALALGWIIWIAQTLMLILGGAYAWISVFLQQKKNAS